MAGAIYDPRTLAGDIGLAGARRERLGTTANVLLGVEWVKSVVAGTSMTGLAKILERFNRKERNLLIRDILGHSEKTLKLSADFRTRVDKKLDIRVSEDAWWATDYHIDWLVGALTVYSQGEKDLENAHPNPVNRNGRRLVRGSQEDVDLVIADGQNLILIEAKAYGAWSNKQARRKVERYEALLRYNEEIRNPARPVDLHVLLMSPRPPQRLERLPKSWPQRLQQELPYVKFRLNAATPVYEVTRCGVDNKSSKAGRHWRIMTKSLARASNPDD